MVHCRVRLEGVESRHAHGSGPAHLAQIVAEEIHDHHVFGAILFACKQLGRQRGIARRRRAAGTRALDRPRLDRPRRGVDAQKTLRRNAGDGRAREFEIAAEGSRITRAQPPVEREPRPCEGRVKPLRQVDLIHVTRTDVVPDAGNGGFVFVTCEVRQRRGRRRDRMIAHGGRERGRGRGRRQSVPHPGGAAARLLRRPACDQPGARLEMIPGNDPVILRQQHVWLWTGNALQRRTPLVTDVAGDAGLKRRQPRECTRRCVITEQLARGFRCADDRDRIGGEKRVPAQRALRRAVEKEEVW